MLVFQGLCKSSLRVRQNIRTCSVSTEDGDLDEDTRISKDVRMRKCAFDRCFAYLDQRVNGTVDASRPRTLSNA